MTTSLSPIGSQFKTVEEADAYDRWFRTKVEAALADARPTIPHDHVMAGMDAIIDAAVNRFASRHQP